MLVAFDVDGPTIAAVKTLRLVSAVLKTPPTADVFEQLRGLSSFSLGVYEGRVAPQLQLQLLCQLMSQTAHSLRAQEMRRSFIITLTKRFLLIEDGQACRL